MAEPTTTTTAVSLYSGAFLVLLGYGTRFVSEWFQDKRILQRERETRDALRRDQLAERRANFQRQTLLELQDALQDLARATGVANVEDERAFNETGEWQRQPLGEEINQQIFLANRRVLLLIVRVRDESLRNMLKEFRQFTLQRETFDREASDAELRSLSNAALLSAMPLLELIQERIGELLRTLDDEESANLKRP